MRTSIHSRLLIALLLLVTLAGCQLFDAEPETAGEEPTEEVSAVETTPGVTPTAQTRPENVPSPLPPADEIADLDATATPLPGPARPARIEIPSAGIDVEVLIVALDQDGYLPTPDEHAGYWALSSPLDGEGNTVIVGHNRTSPVAIFRNLPQVEVGDEITVTDQFAAEHEYEVTDIELLDVAGSPEEAERTVELIDPDLPRRLTLFTCQPDDACTHRLVVIAEPVDG